MSRICNIGLLVVLKLMSINTILLGMTAVQSTHPVGFNKLDSFDQIYIFGDSLSDPGNLFSMTEGTIPANPLYPKKRFSNGLVWSEYFTSKLGLNPTPFTHTSPSPDGINFAVGGATTGDTNINGPALPSLQQQLDAFITPLNQGNQQANSNALYILWAGANDYLGGTITDPVDPVTNLSEAIESLYEVGARHFLVFNLPELGDTPLFQESEAANPSQVNQLSNAHNSLLEIAIKQLDQSLAEIQLGLVDIQGLFKTVMAHPEQFALSNVTDSCLVVACSRPDEYLFWDQLHPTTVAHQIIAEAVFSSLQWPSQSVLEAKITSELDDKLTFLGQFLSSQRRA